MARSSTCRAASRIVHSLLPLLGVAVVFCFALDAGEGERDSPPSVLLILADDLGWKDIGCQGNERIDTPHLDRLAAEGMRFTDAYSAAPVCSPTRAAILTGLSPARLRMTNHLPDQPRFVPVGAELLPAETRSALDPEYVTLAERLKGAGYATAFLGKWHLSGPGGRGGRGWPECYPEEQGFDINIGGCSYGGPPTFFDPYSIHNLPPRREGEYLPDRLADETIEFVRTVGYKPFFVALWNYTVHWPMEAPAELVEKYQKRKGPGFKDPRYAAMIEAYDASIGRILDALGKQGLSERTLVIFKSDNGGFDGVADNRPLRAAKGYLYEGGIRVPLIVRWPGVVAPGSVCSTPVVSTDLYPTVLEAAGLPPGDGEGFDGESLMPLLRQDGKLARSDIYFHYPNYAWHRQNRLGGAVRSGRYKLIERFDDGSVELYDLKMDLGETNDLAQVRPDIANNLRDRLAAWRERVGAAMPRKSFEREADLVVPSVTDGEPAAGRRVRLSFPDYEGSEVAHVLYLPVDWRPGGEFPVIVEFPGNEYGPDERGDVCTGTPEGTRLGYGMSAGREFIWLALPFVDLGASTGDGAKGVRVARKWWGDVDATVEYTKRAVKQVCREFGGDASRVILTGFSRGAIACGYIGRHDDEISRLWRAFAPHSHYDGVRAWGYPRAVGKPAAERLRRVGDRPSFVTHELSVEATRRHVERVLGESVERFTFVALPTARHTDSWVLHPSDEREQLRSWLRRVASP